MTGKPDEVSTFSDLEPLLCDTRNAAQLLYDAIEGALKMAGEELGEDTADALMYAAGNVLDCASKAKAHWYAAHEPQRTKTAA